MDSMLDGFKTTKRQKKDDESPIVAAIIRHMTYTDETNKSSVWASQALCPRKAFYELENETTYESNPVVAMSQVIGIAVEATFIEALELANMVEYKDARVSIASEWPGIKIGGIIDCVVKMPDGSLKIIDIKTFGSTYPSSKRVWHERQVQIYCALSGIHSGSIIGFSRTLSKNNELQLFDFPVDTSEDALINAIATVAYVFVCQKAGVEPLNRNMKKTYCTYCTLVERCWKVEEELSEEQCRLHDKLFLDAWQIGKEIVAGGSLKRILKK